MPDTQVRNQFIQYESENVFFELPFCYRFKTTQPIDQFYSHFLTLKSNAYRNNFKLLRDSKGSYSLINHSDYYNQKKCLKNSMINLQDQLQHYDFKTLFKILLYTLEISGKCLNHNFNLRLLQLLITHFQSKSGSLTLFDEDNPTHFPNIKNTSVSMELDRMDKKVNSLVENEVYLILLLSSFSQLKLQEELSQYFEFFYTSFNRTIPAYSSEDLILLCKILGDLYLDTGLEGLKILVHKSLYSLFEKIDKSDSKVSIYDWIQLIKCVSKCKENQLFKKLAPYIISSIKNGEFNILAHEHQFDLSTEDEKKCYKFVKTNIHLLTTLLMTGFTENLHLIELPLQVITNFLIHYSHSFIQSPRHYDFYSNLSSPYNKENEFVKKLLYPEYKYKLFRCSPDQDSSCVFTKCSNSKTPTLKEKDENIINSSLLKLLQNRKYAFVRGLKLSEMYLRTCYPMIYSKVDNKLLKVLKLLPYQNENDYNIAKITLDENREIIRDKLGENINLLIHPFDIYYLITTDYKERVYLEILDLDKRKRRKLNKQMEFKFNYLKSNGWKCIEVYK